jgi:hypothetical protein
MRAKSRYRRDVIVRTPLPWLALLCLTACDDLKDFRGSYQGQIIGGEFVRSCFPDDTQLALQFDPNQAIERDVVVDAPPNTITTLNDDTFQNTLLEPLRNLPNDPLGELDFPGPQRLRNYLLLARPNTGKLAGRDALVVISLLASESIEVRIIARSADGVPDCPADLTPSDAGMAGQPTARREYFGLWRMRKRKPE